MIYPITEGIKEHLLEGRFGLELESHRVTDDAHMSRVDHPFPGNPDIVRDFSEDHIEINTTPQPGPEEVLAALTEEVRMVQKKISGFERPEVLWYNSNPPKIRDEEDIVFTKYPDAERWNTVYRDSLANRYGRYMMTYAGIHFNYSFSRELLERIWEERPEQYRRFETYQAFHDQFYLDLAEKAIYYGWLVVVLTAASPVLDSSFYDLADYGKTLYTGFASPRCSESGYWNLFTPLFDYSSIIAYADRIQSYAEEGILDVGRELYYPIRLKPPGAYTIEGLKADGVSHIELRMLDLNPFAESAIDLRDIRFLQLFLIWLTEQPVLHLTGRQQVQAAQNIKRAARYDLRIAKICQRTDEPVPTYDYEYGRPGWPKITDNEISRSVQETALDVLGEIRRFYDELYRDTEEHEDILGIIDYQLEKLTIPGKRYAERARAAFGEDYLGSVYAHSKAMQERLLRE